MKDKNSRVLGFTLLELMVAAGLVIVALSGLLAVFAHMITLNENSRNLTLAMAACQDKMEEIRDAAFSSISSYNGSHFDPQGFSASQAEGAVHVNNSNPSLLQVQVSVSWKTRSNRVIGEDKNLNGILDAGEDTNPNLMLDSPATINTLMAQR